MSFVGLQKDHTEMTSDTMRAVGYQAAGGPGVLRWINRPVPDPAPQDPVVRVKAVSVNPADVKIRASATPAAGEARLLGFDAAGSHEVRTRRRGLLR